MRHILKNIVAASLCIGIIFSSGVGAYAAIPKTQLEMTNATSSSDIVFSGQTDFDHPYTYKESEYTSWKCFSMERDGNKFYAAISEEKYPYFRDAFLGRSLTLEGEYVGMAKDGTSVIKATNLVEGEKKTSLNDYLWQINSGSTSNLNFIAYRDLYSVDLYVDVGADNSFLEFDTNPYNTDSDAAITKLTSVVALECLQKMNSLFGLPDWLYEEMTSTRAVDGKQKEEFDYLVVTWTYHPDKGIEAIYRKKTTPSKTTQQTKIENVAAEQAAIEKRNAEQPVVEQPAVQQPVVEDPSPQVEPANAQPAEAIPTPSYAYQASESNDPYDFFPEGSKGYQIVQEELAQYKGEKIPQKNQTLNILGDTYYCRWYQIRKEGSDSIEGCLWIKKLVDSNKNVSYYVEYYEYKPIYSPIKWKKKYDANWNYLWTETY